MALPTVIYPPTEEPERGWAPSLTTTQKPKKTEEKRVLPARCNNGEATGDEELGFSVSWRVIWRRI